MPQEIPFHPALRALQGRPEKLPGKTWPELVNQLLTMEPAQLVDQPELDSIKELAPLIRLAGEVVARRSVIGFLQSSTSGTLPAAKIARELAERYFPEIVDKYKRQLEAYKAMPLNELFVVQAVHYKPDACDLPGRPLRRVQCCQCGDWVQDCREVEQPDQTICKACAGQRYYQILP